MKNVLAGIAAAVMAASLATAPVLAAEDGPGRALIASNTEQLADNAVRSTTAGGTIILSFIPPYLGKVRLKWDIKSKDGTAVRGQAGVNNLSACTRTTTSTDYVTQTCDVRVAGGIPVNVFAFARQQTNTVFLKNVSLSYKVVQFNGKPIIWEPPPVN